MKTFRIILLAILSAIITFGFLIAFTNSYMKYQQPTKTDPEVSDAIEKMQNYQAEKKENVKESEIKEAPEPEISEDPELEESKDVDSDLENMTMSQKNALQEAINYLRLKAFSRQGLIDQLSSEYGSQFPKEDAEFAVAYIEDHDMVDWNEQAVKEAQAYLNMKSFSKDGLIDQLSSEYGSKFTKEQAEYAVKEVGY